MERIGLHVLILLALLAACAPSPDASSVAAATGASSNAQADDDRVRGALGGVEWSPDATAPVLRERAAEASLIRLSRGRPGDPRVVRVRATMALRHHPTDAVRLYLFEAAEGDDPEVAAASLDTLARAFGLSHGAEVRALAEAHLDDPDPGVRMAAREAVARVRVARWISE